MNLKFFIKAAICLLSIILFCDVQKGLAVTANPDPVEYIQPDGTSITIFLHGDEFIHWVSTSDGYTILSNSKGFYEYALIRQDGSLSFSGIRAHNAADRSKEELVFLKQIQPGLFFSKSQLHDMKQLLKDPKTPASPLMGGFPTTGERDLLMILANFSNTTTIYTPADFSNYMNQVNYNGSGSFKDYYLEVSYGLLSVTTTVTIWVNVPQPHDYYGPGSKWGEFAYDAVVAANNQAGVNYADYDNNLDGVVDGVAIIHQGRGQEESGNVNDIWSHSWSLSASGYTAAQCTFDGVLVDAYTTMPEKNGGSMGTIGVMCHEFGHNLGAPDFYDTDYGTGGDYNGTGNWDLMAGGSWNGNSGTKPAHPNAWIKNFFTWTNPLVLSSQGMFTLRNSVLYPDAIRFNTTTDNEYFLCENRQKTGFDASIPSHGLIIYHVDGDFIETHHYSNDINAGSHQGMFPVAANSTTSNGISTTSSSTINTSGCPFPGSTGETGFSDITFPDSKSWNGENTGKPLLDITENTTTKEISLCFLACAGPDDPVNFTAGTAGLNQIDLSWGLNPSGDPVMIAYNTTDSFGVPMDGTSYSLSAPIEGGGIVIYNGSGTAFSQQSLQPGTLYYYKAYSKMEGDTYSSGVITNTTTFCQNISVLPYSEGFEISPDLPACWSETTPDPAWLFVEGNGSGHPANAHNGIRNACLKDGTVNDNHTTLISPVFDLSAYSDVELKFWLNMEKWGTKQDKLSVLYRLNSSQPWIVLQEYAQSFAVWTEITLPFPEVSDQFQFAFEGNAKYGYGVCIDDVSIQDASGVSVNEMEQDLIRVYPTPSNGIFNITSPGKSDQPMTVTIQDLNGKVMARKYFSGKGEYQVDLSYAAGGCYNIIIFTQDRSYVKKLVIIK